MHIALYFHGPLPVQGYGGTQRVVEWLARGLVQLGHRVTLLAGKGSRIADVSMVELDHRATRRPDFDLTPYLPASVDILHSHSPVSPPPGCAQVQTLHGNRKSKTSPPSNTIYLSADHARRHQATSFVYNGIDPSDFVFRQEKSDYDLFLGRLHRIKGYRWAIEGAKRADVRLIIAGGWRPTFRRRLTFVGAVSGQRKADLLAGAACLWMPALWDEPFGLTLIEAMVSGTPILGTHRGALPEIVSPAVGALAGTVEELVELRHTIHRRDPAVCRLRAERWFSHTRMAEEYVRMYQNYLRTGQLPDGRPVPNDI
jgi:glycosyltransferase involved in cell wall biosynthesis